jgi:transcription elongation GreA/GreB family factor
VSREVVSNYCRVERIPHDPPGYNQLKAEVDDLQNEKMPVMNVVVTPPRAISREYRRPASRRVCCTKITCSATNWPSHHGHPSLQDQVSFGCTVVVKDHDLMRGEFTLVGAGERHRR